MQQTTTPWTRRDAALLGVVTAVGAALRAAYLARLDLPPYDPWRHLLLIDSLRQGRGFTLFAGQPYLWYSPPWYELCAALPRGVGPQWPAALLSLLAVPLTYALLRRREGSLAGAAAGSLVLAAAGPAIAFTVHYGPEAAALALVLGGIAAAAASRGRTGALLGGLATGAGIALRLNFAFDALLLLPWLRTRSRAVAAAVGGLLPLAALWWRNHRIIAGHDWLFTWDGLATPTDGFGPLSTLLLQRHPDIAEGLRRLHAMIVPVPEWIRGPDGPRWDLVVFVGLGVACLAVCRRFEVLLAGGLTLAYFLVLDRTGSSNFFRLYLAVFPAFALAAGALAARLARTRRPWPSAAGLALALAIVLSGARLLSPPPMVPLAMVTPPESLLLERSYMVNSTFYHPESLIERFPDRRFVGLPLRPERFAEFRAAFPDYDAILWHDFSVQEPLRRYVVDELGWIEARSAINAYGRRYVVLLPPPAAAP